MISRSVVARLLPRATTVEPSLSISSSGSWVIFARRARAMAASSEERSVVFPRSIIVFVKDRMFSFEIPSWPAASATLDISTTEAGNSFAIARIPASNSLNSLSVASTVFRTPAKALSKSIADFTNTALAANKGAVKANVIVAPNRLNSVPIF